MFGKFTLRIDLGNEAMGDASAVAQALREVASKVEAGATDGRIRDGNGNTVGEYELAGEE